MKSNNLKVLFLSYYTALTAGYAFPVAGILSPQISHSLGIKTAYVIIIDSTSLIGMLVGNIASGILIRKLGGRKSVILSSFVLACTQYAISIVYTSAFYGIIIFFAGVGLGILITSINYIIVSRFSEEYETASKLNIMNFFVGTGGFLGTSLAGIIVNNFDWRTVFLVNSLIYLSIGLCAISCIFKEKIPLTVPKKKNDTKRQKVITKGVIITAIALLLYVYIEYIISYWFAAYMQKKLFFNIEITGFILSSFWLCLAIFRYILGKFVLTHTTEYKVIIILSLFIIIGFASFLSSNLESSIWFSVILLGVGCSALYPTLVSYGSRQAKNISPSVISFLISAGTLGGVSSLIISGILGASVSYVTAIYLGPFFAIGIIILISISRYSKT